MRSVSKTVFIVLLIFFFYQNCFAENPSEEASAVEKLSGMREELVLSFSGTSVEERYKTATVVEDVSYTVEAKVIPTVELSEIEDQEE